MDEIGLGNLVADPLDRVEREFRVLQDHRHALAADAEHLLFAERQKIGAAKA